MPLSEGGNDRDMISWGLDLGLFLCARSAPGVGEEDWILTSDVRVDVIVFIDTYAVGYGTKSPKEEHCSYVTNGSGTMLPR